MNYPEVSSLHPQDRIIFVPSDVIENWKMKDLETHGKMTVEDEAHRQVTSRLVPQCYKIAMNLAMVDERILSVIEATPSKQYPKRLIMPGDIAELAIKICEQFLRPRLNYVVELSKCNDQKNLQIQVIKVLTKHNGIASRSKIQRDTKMNKRNFDETILSMEESGQIEVLEEKSDGGRPVMIIKQLST
jgi:hypothetical protein